MPDKKNDKKLFFFLLYNLFPYLPCIQKQTVWRFGVGSLITNTVFYLLEQCILKIKSVRVREDMMNTLLMMQ